MAINIEMYPVGAGEDADVIWNNRVAIAINEVSDLMGTASTSTGMGVTTRTDGGAQVTDNLVIYPLRYLHIRYAENADGSSQIIDLSAFNGSTIHVGTFNSDSQNLSGSEAFFYQEFAWDNGNNNLYYNAVGGGRVIFDVQATSPGTGYTLQNTPLLGASALDLEAGVGQGTDGSSVFAVYATNAAGVDQSFDRGTRNFVRFVAGVAAPSLPVTGTFVAITGADGADAVTVEVTSSLGTAFRNNAGGASTTRATIRIAGQVQSDTAHDGYHYRWTDSSSDQTICVLAADRSAVNNGANGFLTSADGMTCTTGVPADSTVTTSISGALREILVGPEDINLMGSLLCDVSNIPD